MNKKTILIIEDETPLRETLYDLLDINGFKVYTAENGKEGCKQIMRHNPDIVICDVNMPGMSGFEVLSTINSLMSEDIIPAFLFVTARAQLDDIKQGMQLGADDYITKPFESTELLQTIRMRLEKREKLLGFSKDETPKDDIPTPIEPKNKHEKVSKKISLPTTDGFRYLSLHEIVKCEADRSYCIFYIDGGEKLLVSKPMKEFEKVLLRGGFMRVHKSFMVNMDFVKSYVRGKGGYLILKDGSQVHVAVRKKEELMSFLKSN